LTRGDFATAIAPWLKAMENKHATESGAAASYAYVIESLRRTRDHINSNLEFEHGTERKTPRGNVYRPYRLTIADHIVAVLVLRASEAFRLCEIDVLITLKPKGLEPHAIVRAALLFALSDAVRNGGSMALQFTAACGPGIPTKVVEAARDFKISLERGANGSVSPDEARRLYLHLCGLAAASQSRVFELSGRGFFSPERIGFLAASAVWPMPQLEMLLQACPHPELLLGSGVGPESRHLYALALAHGRAAVLGGLADRAIRYRDRTIERAGSDDAIEGVTATLADARPSYANIPCVADYSSLGYIHGPIPQGHTWTNWSAHSSGTVELRAGDRVLILPRGRGREEIRLFLKQDIAMASDSASRLKAMTLLVYPAELMELSDAERRGAVAMARSAGVSLLACPESLANIDSEIERRMREGRRVRP
jgi:hypothetical protein